MGINNTQGERESWGVRVTVYLDIWERYAFSIATNLSTLVMRFIDGEWNSKGSTGKPDQKPSQQRGESA